MAKRPDWTFPDLPPFLRGLTPVHLAGIRALARFNGQAVTFKAYGQGHVLSILQPVPVTLTVVGPDDDAPIVVLPPGQGIGDAVRIAMEPGGETVVTWSPQVRLADVLECLDAQAVVRTSQLEDSGKHGSN